MVTLSGRAATAALIPLALSLLAHTMRAEANGTSTQPPAARPSLRIEPKPPVTTWQAPPTASGKPASKSHAKPLAQPLPKATPAPAPAPVATLPALHRGASYSPWTGKPYPTAAAAPALREPRADDPASDHVLCVAGCERIDPIVVQERPHVPLVERPRSSWERVTWDTYCSDGVGCRAQNVIPYSEWDRSVTVYVIHDPYWRPRYSRTPYWR